MLKQRAPYIWMLVAPGLASCALAHWLAGDGALMRHPLAAPGAWLVGIGLTLWALWQAPATPTPHAGPPWRLWEAGALVALCLIALHLRMSANNVLPYPLSGDEAGAGLWAVAATQGKFNNPFVTGWFSFPSLFFLIQGLMVHLFGATYAALRTSSALVGALTVAGVYVWGRAMFGRLAAGVAAIMLAVANVHIHFSRVGLNNIWDGLFAVCTCGATWYAWHTGRRRWFLAAGTLLGLSQYFYISARLLPLVLLAWLGLQLLTDRRLVWRRRADIGSVAALALAVYLPLGLFLLKHPDEFFATAARASTISQLLPGASQGWLTAAAHGEPALLRLLERYRDASLGMISVPQNSWYISGRPMFLGVCAALLVIGVLVALLDRRNQRHWLPLLLLAGASAIGTITESTPAAQRYVIALPAAALFMGAALALICRRGAGVWRGRHRSALAALLAGAVSLLAALNEYNFYFNEYSQGLGRGDTNTQIATEIALRVGEYPGGSEVYMFGAPRMFYGGFDTFAFLAPQVVAVDVLEPLRAPPGWTLHGQRVAFVFLPERIGEAEIVKRRYPGGSERWFYDTGANRLCMLYEVDGPEPK